MEIGWIAAAGSALAADLTIREVQFVPNPATNDASAFRGGIHNVVAGIVTHVWHGFNDRVYLQDPNEATWGAIVVKDGEGGELSNSVNVGDRVRLDNIYVDEFLGTTFLQYRRTLAPDVSFTILDTGNPIPPPPILTAADVSNPADRAATEPYESMVISLEGVWVGQRNLGKASDNYELVHQSTVAWATDYMNVDAGAPYDPRIITGAFLQRITGVIEQYTKPADGWDYYQINTRFSADIVPEPATVWLLVAGAALMLTSRRGRVGNRTIAAAGARNAGSSPAVVC